MDMKYVVLFDNGFYYKSEDALMGEMTYSLSKSKLYNSPYSVDRDIYFKKYCESKNLKYSLEMVKLKIIK